MKKKLGIAAAIVLTLALIHFSVHHLDLVQAIKHLHGG